MSANRKRPNPDSREDESCFFNPFRKTVTNPVVSEPSSDTDALMAQELNALSLEERERVYEDIHGMPTVVDESPDFVENALNSMENELAKIKRKPAYDKALFLSPRYVKKRSLRLMFLRAEKFDAEGAAKRFVAHFEHKLELFGIDKLGRDIHYRDLGEEDIDAYRVARSLQFLPSKDRSGRLVVVMFHNFDRWENQLRVCWYLVMSKLAEDEESQRKGQVGITYNVGCSWVSHVNNPMFIKHGAKMTYASPLRWTGFHFCYDERRIRPVVSFTQLAIGKQSRLRFRAHYGTYVECKYALLCYGIPAEEIPVNDHGTTNMNATGKYLDKKRVSEKAGSPDMHPSCANNIKNEIECPSNTDILLGRGRPFQEYIGNMRLFQIIDKNQTCYDNMARGEKWVLTNRMVVIAREGGGRFLKKSSDGEYWEEVSEEVARGKVAHIFRNKLRKFNPGKGVPQPQIPVS